MLNLFQTQPAVEVPLSNELMRIAKMPRRVWSDEEAEELAAEMTEILKTPYGQMELRPLQAIALFEIGTQGGLFGPLSVGMGKTLISLLAAVAAFAERPLLLIPASMKEKTERDRRNLANHWRLPRFLRIMTYEWLGREQAADALEKFQPDLFIGDEAHKLKNPRAAVTRRVRRYMNDHREIRQIDMSGTMSNRSLHDYAHLVRWSLGPEKMFVPRNYVDLEMWADALDEAKEDSVEPGALKVLCNEEELELWKTEPRRAARSAFRRRMIETPGVVASYQTDVDATLTVNAVEVRVSPKIDEAFELLRNAYRTPDGWTFSDGLAMARHARELALGFYYVWDPRPPKHWMLARKRWHQYVRNILKYSRRLDSEKQVRREHKDSLELLEWKRVKNEFVPNTVPVWIDDSVLEYCAAWAQDKKGIIWTEHSVVGQRLERDFGLTYYGKKGRSAAGRFIMDHSPKEPLVASIKSSGEGRNLQAWSSALVTSSPGNGKTWEQLLGRLHRELQEADEVTFDMLTLCAEHVGSFWQAVEDSRVLQERDGSPQKLLIAGLNVMTPDELYARGGKRWRKD